MLSGSGLNPRRRRGGGQPHFIPGGVACPVAKSSPWRTRRRGAPRAGRPHGKNSLTILSSATSTALRPAWAPARLGSISMARP